MLVRLTLAALLAAGLAVAQPGGGSVGGMGGEGMGGGGGSRGGGGDMGGMGGGGGMMPKRQSKLDIFCDKLKLKSDQKSQVETIFSAANEKAVPVRDQLNKGRQVIAQAILAKASDADVNKLLAEYATVSAQMTGIEADAFAKVYALLKPNQQAKAGPAFELMAGMFYPASGGGRTGGGRGRGGR
jgi:Spy/CpxP family protein refolding chaperone